MSAQELPYHFIAIEGNIGAGKTTLCKRIAGDTGKTMILEQFTDNPFLPHFYQNPLRYAFQVELFFMTERHKQLQNELIQPQLFQKSFISDYYFMKTLLFAKTNLQEDEFRLFQRLFETLNAGFPQPELVVYLHRPVYQLLEFIKGRGRQMETNISPAYLQQLQQIYLEFFRTVTDFPVLILDVEGLDFEQNEHHYNFLIDCLKQRYKPGVNQVRFLN